MSSLPPLEAQHAGHAPVEGRVAQAPARVSRDDRGAGRREVYRAGVWRTDHTPDADGRAVPSGSSCPVFALPPWTRAGYPPRQRDASAGRGEHHDPLGEMTGAATRGSRRQAVGKTRAEGRMTLRGTRDRRSWTDNVGGWGRVPHRRLAVDRCAWTGSRDNRHDHEGRREQSPPRGRHRCIRSRLGLHAGRSSSRARHSPRRSALSVAARDWRSADR